MKRQRDDPDDSWPRSASDMARRIRAHDWASTPLGPVEVWPQSLRTTVDLILAHGFPMLLLWGPERIGLYNDAFRPLLDEDALAPLGQPFHEVWPEIRDAIELSLQRAWAGETVTLNDAHYHTARYGSPKNIWLDATISPLRDDVGVIAGVLMTAFDTTERVLAQRTLRDSEQRYRSFVTASADVVYRMSADWSQMRQLDGQGFIVDTPQASEDWMDRYILPDDREAVQAAIDQAIRTKSMFELEHRVIRADGTPGWTMSRAMPILDEQGAIAEWLGAAKDVTERKVTDQALQESEQRLQRVLETDAVAVLFFTPDGALIDANHVFLKMTGYSREEVEAGQLTWQALTPVEYHAESQAQMDLFAKTGRIGPYEKEYLRKDGSRAWMLFAGRDLGDGTIVEFGVDITDRKRAEAALRTSEERQAFLLALANRLRPVDDMSEVLAIATRSLGEYLGADRVGYAEDRAGEIAVLSDYTDGVASLVGRYRYDEYGPELLEAFRQGRSIVRPDIANDPSLTAAEKKAHAQLQLGATVNVPLLANGDLKAVLFLHFRDAHPFDERELALLQGVAEQTWTALQRARAKAELRASEERQAFLLKLSDTIRPLSDPNDVQCAVTSLLGEYLRLDRCGYFEIDASGEFVAHSRNYCAQGIVPFPDGVQLDDYGEAIADVVRGGETLVIDDIASDPRRAETSLAPCAAARVVAAVAVPLIKAGVLVADFFAHQSHARAWTAAEVTLIEDVAERTWAAVERTRAEAALRQSQAKYRSLFETMNQGYDECEIIRDADGRAVDYRILDMNPAFERLIGVSVADAQGRTASEIIPGLEDWWTETFDEVVRTGEPRHVEREVAPLGRWYEVHAYPRGGDRFSALFDDITYRKGAEEMLRNSEDRQAFLLKLSDALRPLADPNEVQSVAVRLLGEYLEVNRANYYEADADGVLTTLRGYSTDGLTIMPQTIRIAEFGQQWLDIYRQGRNVVVSDITSDERFSEEERAAWRAAGPSSALGVPLIKSGQLRALLGVNTAAPRHWTDIEVSLVEDVAERTWAAVERARVETMLRERETELALTQRIGQVASVEVALIGPPVGHRSPEYRRLHGLPPDRALESHEEWLARLHPDDREREDREFTSALEGGDTLESEYRIIRPSDGEERWISAKGLIVRDAHGKAIRFLGAHIDITEQKRADTALRESEWRLKTLVEGVPQLVWRAADEGEWTWASPQWTEFTGQSEVDSHGFGWLDAVHPDDRQVVRDTWRGAIDRGEFHADYRLCNHKQGCWRWFQTRATAVRDNAGTIIEWLGTSTDVDDLRVLQERLHVVVAELQHRARNILTIVRSVFARTVEAGGELEEMADHFKGRLDALARTQVIITRNAAGTADLENLIREELLSVGVSDGPTLCIEGPDVALPHKAAESLGLAIHELTTNALKYGALRIPGATLDIRWSVNVGYRGQRTLVFTWVEQGVPAIPLQPNREGFGRELIEEALPYRLGAETKLEFRGGGVRCSISLPLTAEEEGASG